MNLSDQEQALIISFNANKAMSNAVKKVLLAAIYSHGTLEGDPMRNWAISIARSGYSNERMGANLMACVEALDFIESGFKKLEEIKVEEKKEKKGNPAL